MRLAIRTLARAPAFTAIAVLTLAIGIGTTTTIFAIVDELIFQPARGTGSDDVYSLGAIQIPDYETLRTSLPEGVKAVAAVETGIRPTLQIPGRAERVSVWRVSGGYARVQRVAPQVGRWISDDDNAGGAIDPAIEVDGIARPIVLGQLGADVIVISDRIWHDWFNASPAVIGRTIALAGRPMRVIGVAPAEFETTIDVWQPLGRRRLLTREELEARRVTKRRPGWAGPLPEPTQPTLQVLLRKDPSVSASAVSERLQTLFGARSPSVDMPASRTRIVPRRGDERLVPTGYLILAFAALIFAAACANLGNMLFARATEREGELAVRMSIGATRFDVFRVLFGETVFICAAASGVGLLFAGMVLDLFTDAFPGFQISYWQRVTLDLSIDWRIAGFAAAGGAIAALLVGAASLWRSSRVSLLARMAASGPAVVARAEGRTVRTMLVAVQVTSAVLLLITTGMLLENSSQRLTRRVLFDRGGLVAATIELPDLYDQSRGRRFFDQLLERVRAIDGVAAAGLADALPGGESPSPRGGVSAIVSEAPERGLSGVPKRLDGHWIHASAGLAGALGLPIVRGRDFGPLDQDGSEPVALVTESTALALWPGEQPLGRRLRCCGATYFRTVVGVLADPVGRVATAQTHNLGEAIGDLSAGGGPGVFVVLPAAQQYRPTLLLVARSSVPRAIVQPIRDVIASLDPAVPVFNAGEVNATQYTRAASEQAVRLLAGVLGAIALGIAVFGVYALVSYYVSRRTREFGLRLALGSTRGQIARLVVDYAVHIVLIGLLPGVLLASLGARYFQAQLRELHPNGLTAWVVVPLLMLAVGVVAALLPARRAARVDPYQSLKDL